MDNVFDELIRSGNSFRKHLASTRAALGETGFPWYPYDSLVNLYPISKLLKKAGTKLDAITGAGPVLDVGCGDGDFGFFLESRGVAVHAIDNPATNMNGMRGARALQQALTSSVELHACDLDGRFELPQGRFSAAFFLGTLYHLKNPFYTVELLASRARWCFLSTRVAQCSPDGRTGLRDLPVAYLLDTGEANADATNYWIFTMPALLRMVRRAGWDVRASVNSGDLASSDPVHDDKDERAFLLLESRSAA